MLLNGSLQKHEALIFKDFAVVSFTRMHITSITETEDSFIIVFIN